MAKLVMPKNEDELRAMTDEDLQLMRDGLVAQQDQIRIARKLLALEAERRMRSPKAKG